MVHLIELVPGTNLAFSSQHVLVYHITKNWLDSQNSIPLSSKTETEVLPKEHGLRGKGQISFLLQSCTQSGDKCQSPWSPEFSHHF